MNRTMIRLAIGIALALLAAQVVHARGFGGYHGAAVAIPWRQLPRSSYHGSYSGGYHESGGYAKGPKVAAPRIASPAARSITVPAARRWPMARPAPRRCRGAGRHRSRRQGGQRHSRQGPGGQRIYP